jgi:Lrp/AsnC family transcriptional regulator, leucine-responsive regulatory protein
MQDLERLHSDVITRLPGVERVQSTLTLRTVKRTTCLPVGE